MTLSSSRNCSPFEIYRRESVFGTRDATPFFYKFYVAFVIDMSPQPCLDFKVVGKDLTEGQIK